MLTDLIQPGEPVAHRGIVVTPLYPRRDPVARYVTLGQALVDGLRVTETSRSGSVPELLVDNPLADDVLLYDGEELVGSKQNRILDVTVLAGARTTVAIPVSCVEEGRWSWRSAGFAAAAHISHAALRRRKAELLAAAPPLARGVAQGGVWEEVRAKAARLGVVSPTSANADTFSCRAPSRASLRPPPRWSGSSTRRRGRRSSGCRPSAAGSACACAPTASTAAASSSTASSCSSPSSRAPPAPTRVASRARAAGAEAPGPAGRGGGARRANARSS